MNEEQLKKVQETITRLYGHDHSFTYNHTENRFMSYDQYTGQSYSVSVNADLLPQNAPTNTPPSDPTVPAPDNNQEVNGIFRYYVSKNGDKFSEEQLRGLWTQHYPKNTTYKFVDLSNKEETKDGGYPLQGRPEDNKTEDMPKKVSRKDIYRRNMEVQTKEPKRREIYEACVDRNFEDAIVEMKNRSSDKYKEEGYDTLKGINYAKPKARPSKKKVKEITIEGPHDPFAKTTLPGLYEPPEESNDLTEEELLILKNDLERRLDDERDDQ